MIILYAKIPVINQQIVVMLIWLKKFRFFDVNVVINSDYLHFEYNPRGSITNNSFHRFSYNRANQMVSAVSDSATHQYRYDGHNRRVKQVKTQPNGDTETEYSLYSQDDTLLYRETPLTNGELGPANYLYLLQRALKLLIELVAVAFGVSKRNQVTVKQKQECVMNSNKKGAHVYE